MEPFDFVCSLETFILAAGSIDTNTNNQRSSNNINPTKTTIYSLNQSQTSPTPSSSSTSLQLFCLDRDMVEYLSWCEETCLESLVWTSRSPVWPRLAQLNLNPSYLPSLNSSSSVNTSLVFPLYDDLLVSSTTSVSAFESTAKQNQIITRVVCNNNNNNSNIDSKRIQVSYFLRFF